MADAAVTPRPPFPTFGWLNKPKEREVEDGEFDAVFDAATAYWVVLSELIVELVEQGSLSRTGAANTIVRSEAVMSHLPDHSLARYAHNLLAQAVANRLALQPEIHLRRHRDQKEQGYTRPAEPEGDDPAQSE